MCEGKVCGTCSKGLPLDQFTFDKRKADGRSSECRECNRARARRYYEANKAKVMARTARYHTENTEWRDRYYRSYYEARKPEYRERRHAWYQANRERATLLAKKWRAENRDKFLLIARNHASKRRAQMAAECPRRL